ncbi:MAG: hypothetical protein COY73_02980 [Candidatus Nealsonbacteria bacterium CG_4_10_14_0_8_um_filter_37_14]|uniref:Uncharacterized protein n=1 Tax=Candidatus Nealsonbacteria bacterium CG_4_10_14_0_8_um_filter_37_14 TaxID=1974684 RepID=A0A2M7R6K6_9BACT|nr:MAG: hypothetical protein COV63_02695 [Candidatus Nealsonbacteria bacterium CG11_big_fil_rev_8_21_14_0_20_37_68]PIW92093.1 MAG: hypothetical protein COZ89_01665 [Candidatus Nealsonbacteria bacterium CG_4_8_14_3_um_filter_37_23]PIY88764.1 MAG: hypothetical protein COY73_02980 [Candidatus Nealsonbacteria bacterium CG_4_10_14_0_8_um_filter_37_14]
MEVDEVIENKYINKSCRKCHQFLSSTIEERIEERIKCEKCGEETAVLVGATRTPDEDGLVGDSWRDFINDKLWLDYECRNCGHKFIKTIGGL